MTGLEERVLGEIKKDNRISRRLIAKKLDISDGTVKEYIDKLKKKGVLKRIGKTSGGSWKVINSSIK
ncbi:MAG: winged helix-turn-helix domain-containing protein [Actinobacteria bacterium]|nr:winged helix-turn-helix domain-containing protein [Actinomycetota bacterium]